MLVRNWMSKDVITVNVNDPIIDAIRLLKHNDIGRLPVMQKGKMVGIVTDGDLKKASASDAVPFEVHELLYLLSKIKIDEIMSNNPITVPPDYTVEETAEVLEIEKRKVKAGMIFKGTPAAPGVIEGPATVITIHKDLRRIRPGTILVCPCMAPTLTAIFPKIKAIVTDHGGTLASAATIAKEYGIPAVVGTLAATESINDGDVIRVNGTVGRVEIVSRSH